MTSLSDEQDCDLEWATNVVSGRGESCDCSFVATGMIYWLAANGATDRIKQVAGVLLVNNVASAA